MDPIQSLGINRAILTQLRMFPLNLIISRSEGIGGIYLGNLWAAFNSQIQEKHEITAILSVLANFVLPPHIEERGVRSLVIQCEDVENQNIQKYLEEMIAFIDECRNEGRNILVHCYAGISRSASAVIAYLIKKLNFNFRSALAFCKSRRSIVQPNLGFMKQLRQFSINFQNQKTKTKLQNEQLLAQNTKESTLYLEDNSQTNSNLNKNSFNNNSQLKTVIHTNNSNSFNKEKEEEKKQIKLKSNVDLYQLQLEKNKNSDSKNFNLNTYEVFNKNRHEKLKLTKTLNNSKQNQQINYFKRQIQDVIQSSKSQQNLSIQFNNNNNNNYTNNNYNNNNNLNSQNNSLPQKRLLQPKIKVDI